MTELQLPPSLKDGRNVMTASRQIAIVGANGAGKSRFMEEMMSLCGDRAYCLNALSAFFPERDESTMPGSIDDLYRKAIRQQSYMRTDAVSQLDKLSYMLFADEMESLLSLKESARSANEKLQFQPTKTDKIKEVWERIFPGNKIIRDRGKLLFTTYAGKDYVYSGKLSQGEQTVLYYLGGVLYAPKDAVIFIDSPQLFIHPSIIATLWNAIEELRSDCTFVYNTVDVDFIASRTSHRCIWVKSYSSEQRAWDYEVLNRAQETENLLIRLAGSRQPILFIEGDADHSIDIRLYGAVFRNYTVRPLGSCDKVIETTRSFNDLKNIHHLRSMGIVDRDRRTDAEVGYLRNKNIMVPDVAEIENIFLLPEVVLVMARRQGKDGEKIVRRLQRDIIKMFKRDADEQALQHVRYRVKREVECKIDARFKCITALETHLQALPAKLQPRKQYNRLREAFAQMILSADYKGILRVYNNKPMLPESDLHSMLGYHSKDEYINAVIKALKGKGRDARELRDVMKECLHYQENEF